MRSADRSILAGLVLIGAGALFLLQNLGFLGQLQDVIWAPLFAIGGAALIWRRMKGAPR